MLLPKKYLCVKEISLISVSAFTFNQFKGKGRRRQVNLRLEAALTASENQRKKNNRCIARI